MVGVWVEMTMGVKLRVRDTGEGEGEGEGLRAVVDSLTLLSGAVAGCCVAAVTAYLLLVHAKGRLNLHRAPVCALELPVLKLQRIELSLVRKREVSLFGQLRLYALPNLWGSAAGHLFSKFLRSLAWCVRGAQGTEATKSWVG